MAEPPSKVTVEPVPSIVTSWSDAITIGLVKRIVPEHEKVTEPPPLTAASRVGSSQVVTTLDGVAPAGAVDTPNVPTTRKVASTTQGHGRYARSEHDSIVPDGHGSNRDAKDPLRVGRNTDTTARALPRPASGQVWASMRPVPIASRRAA